MRHQSALPAATSTWKKPAQNLRRVHLHKDRSEVPCQRGFEVPQHVLPIAANSAGRTGYHSTPRNSKTQIRTRAARQPQQLAHNALSSSHILNADSLSGSSSKTRGIGGLLQCRISRRRILSVGLLAQQTWHLGYIRGRRLLRLHPLRGFCRVGFDQFHDRSSWLCNRSWPT
jgi:hypothetical protein